MVEMTSLILTLLMILHGHWIRMALVDRHLDLIE